MFVVVVIPKVEDTGIEKEPTHAQSDTRNSRSDHGGGAVEDEGGWGGNADGGTTVEKDQISLAVSPRCCISCVFASVFIPRHPVGCADENTQ